MDTPIKRVGRPPKTGIVQTSAQRQAAYRGRLVQALDGATVNPGTASTTALLACLKHHFTNIETVPDHADIARRLATPVMVELCERYKIKLT